MLAVPLFATILILYAFPKVHSDGIVIGYDPLGIAKSAHDILPLISRIDEPAPKSERTGSMAMKRVYAPSEVSLPSNEVVHGESLSGSGRYSAPQASRSTSVAPTEGEQTIPLMGRESCSSENERTKSLAKEDSVLAETERSNERSLNASIEESEQENSRNPRSG